MKVTVDDKALRVKLTGLGKKLNKKAVLKVAAIQAQSDLEQHFIDEKDSTGQQWKPLSKYTLSQRRKKGAGAKILRDTGAGSRMDFEISEKKAKVGTTKDYMEKHNKGFNTTLNNKNKIVPKREWAYVSEEGRQKISKALKEHFNL